MSKSKRFLCLLMSLLLVFSMGVWPTVAVSAEETTAQPRYSYTCMTSTGLAITTDGTASCYADVDGYYGITTKVHIEMRLQQYIALQWTTIAEWEGTFNDVWGALSKTKTVYTGRYRVKANFTVYSGSAYEKIENISQEKYVTVTKS